MRITIIMLTILTAGPASALTPQEFTQTLSDIGAIEDQGHFDAALGKYRDLLQTEGLTDNQKVSVFQRLVTLAAATARQEALDEALDGLQVLPDSPARTEALVSLIRKLGGRRSVVIKKILADNEALFTREQKIDLYSVLATGALSVNDRANFDEALAFILSRPLPMRIGITRQLAHQIAGKDFAGYLALQSVPEDFERAVKLFHDDLQLPDITPEDKWAVLHGLLDVTISKSRPFDYAAVKAVKAEIDELIVRQEIRPDTAKETYVLFGNAALRVCDYPAAREAFEKAAELNPHSGTVAFKAAEMALLFNDKASATKFLDQVIECYPITNEGGKDPNIRTNAAVRYQASVLKALDAGKPLADVDEEFAAYGFTSEDRMNVLRDASTRFMVARRYDEVRAIHAEVEKMLKPLVEKVFTVRHAANVPRSADAWERSSLLQDTRYRETRFEGTTHVYRERQFEVARLKDAPEDPQDAVPAGYETAAYLAYDENGLHLYVQARDPDAPKIGLGLMPGGRLKMFVQPGVERPYHWFVHFLPDAEKKYEISWAGPGKHYRLTYDHLTKDVCVNPDSVGAYTFIPWTLCYEDLPVGDAYWKLGIMREYQVGDGSFEVGFGGSGHELERGLTLRFDFSPDRLIDIKRNIAQRVFAKYRQTRNDPDGCVTSYNDRELGDPAFYAKELKPLIEELDQAGEELLASPDAGDIDRLFENYVPFWAEIQYVVADKRSAYLKGLFLSE